MDKPLTQDDIKLRLQQYEPADGISPEDYRDASVLIPFYPRPEGLSLVLMKRPDYDGAHGGQISFPGGSKDESDPGALQVALRETEEEFGIDKSSIEVWGRLKHQYTSVSRFWVTPFVGLIPYPAEFNPNEEEVERLLIIPFSHLTDSEHFSIGTYNWKGFEVPSYLYRYHDDVIWGLTARIVYSLITLLKTGEESTARWPPS